MCGINRHDESYFCCLVYEPMTDTWMADYAYKLRSGCSIVLKAEELEELEPLIKYCFKYENTLQRTMDVGWDVPPEGFVVNA